MARFEVKWEAHEYDHHDKTSGWYWGSIAIAIVLLAYAVWQRNYLFAFFIVLAEILVIIWANREPQKLAFTLNEEGIAIGDFRFHKHHDIHSYSIGDGFGDGWAEIVFHPRQTFRSPIRILVPKEHTEVIHHHLRDRLSNVNHEESFIDALRHYVRF
jgi:hypothetical protein